MLYTVYRDRQKSVKGEKMKLRSIVLAGLLTAGFVGMAGCSSDEVDEYIKDVLKMSFVTVVNNSENDYIQMNIPDLESSSSNLTVEYGTAEFYVVTKQDNYTVSDDNGNSMTFAKNTGNLFGLCRPNEEGSTFVTDTSNTHRIGVVNLSNGSIAETEITIGIDDNDDNVTDRNVSAGIMNLAPCRQLDISEFDDVSTDTVNEVWINGEALNLNPNEGDDSLATALDFFGGKAKYDLVFFDANDFQKGVIVPLVAPVPE